MPPGRKPNPASAPVADNTNRAALRSGNAALTEVGKRSAEVAERYGDGMPYERERLVTEARYLMGQSAEAMLEAGKRLVQIKENEPWGEFTEIVENRLGLNSRTARLMMEAAVKYLSPALESKRQTFSALGRSKLFDLMVESEGDLAELAEGGTLAGLSLDDMQSMSVREMRAALADARQTIAAKEKVLAKRDDKIARLEERIERPWKPNEQSVAQSAEEAAAIDALVEATNAIDVDFTKLGQAAAALQENPREAMRLRALQAVQYLVARMRDVIVENGLEVRVDDDALGVRPAFLDFRG